MRTYEKAPKFIDFWKVLNNVIRQSDILLEVIDARMPELTRNIKIENTIIRKRKNFIFVLNKADLITNSMRRKLLDEMKDENAVLFSSKNKQGIADLRRIILEKKKPNWKNIRIGVVGYPNTGKSSVINALSHGAKTKVSPVAGMTRGVQWIAGTDELFFLDSPGVIPPYDRDESEKAIMSIIDPDNLQRPDIAATRIIEMFLNNNDEMQLKKFYDIETESSDSMEIMLEIGKKKNYMRKGGKIDERRTALLIIRDWQRGNLLMNTEVGDRESYHEFKL
jgi:ribosome biogenesis GTPase A